MQTALVAQACQGTGDAEEHGGVAVVAAGMAGARVLRHAGTRAGKVLGAFHNGQCVDVGPQGHAPPRLSRVDHAEHRGGRGVAPRYAKAVELLLDKGRGLDLLAAELGQAVNVPTAFDHIGLELVGQAAHLFGIYHVAISSVL